LEPGEELDLTIYLSTPAKLRDTYSLGVWLVSAVPGDTGRLAGLDTWPGNGNYPTTVWQPGEVIVDRYRLRIPAEVRRAQGWLVQINAYRLGDDVWLPLHYEGGPAGDRAVLGVVRVGASASLAIPEAHRIEPAPVFGDSIALRGADGEVDPNTRTIMLSLWWEALASPGADYTVFAHLVSLDGEMVGNGDGPPLGGGFPTTMWEPGDLIQDDHLIQVSPDIDPGTYEIVVGWYDPVSGSRLPSGDGDSVRLSWAARVE
jgi:hypothetical protein